MAYHWVWGGGYQQWAPCGLRATPDWHKWEQWPRALTHPKSLRLITSTHIHYQTSSFYVCVPLFPSPPGHPLPPLGHPLAANPTTCWQITRLVFKMACESYYWCSKLLFQMTWLREATESFDTLLGQRTPNLGLSPRDCPSFNTCIPILILVSQCSD